jgi:signal transduction histidine kinase
LVSLFKDGMLEAKDIYPMMEELAKNMDYTTNLVDNLLYWAAAQLKGEQFDPKSIDLRDLIKRNRLLFEEQLKNKEIELLISSETAEYQVYVDKDMIDLVLRNLLSNALKYTDRGGRIWMETVKQSDQYLEICIADNGVGMNKEQLAKLFFEDIKSVMGTENERGTGLGLMLCKDFVEKNGGTIWVESELGKGTKFYFTVPLKVG